ncbi:hypothetical protein DFH08DRAFT_815170 [Mycena albidolilacea]|uniref:Uncharacterized protein n=1 Tax=Mycena albidolilacea TaxID=1033008 RepID=A0AAD6ZP79_9AGAR|nr:hypothetical protein DFH08DRAFT_815170 [Mycena albidolilacea]
MPRRHLESRCLGFCPHLSAHEVLLATVQRPEQDGNVPELQQLHNLRRYIRGQLFLRSPASDFRSIPIGDLNLLAEVGSTDIIEYQDMRRQKTGALIRRVPAVVGKRQIHQARVFGSQETMTVVIYNGHDFEKAGRNVLCGRLLPTHPRYSGERKWEYVRRTVSNLIQGVLPVETVRHIHRNSPLASAYLEYTLPQCRNLNAATTHWNRKTGVWLYDLDSPDYDAWICVSTGRLCIDIGATSSTPPLLMAPLLDNPIADGLLVTSGTAAFEATLLTKMVLNDIHTVLCNGSNPRSFF